MQSTALLFRSISLHHLPRIAYIPLPFVPSEFPTFSRNTSSLHARSTLHLLSTFVHLCLRFPCYPTTFASLYPVVTLVRASSSPFPTYSSFTNKNHVQLNFPITHVPCFANCHYCITSAFVPPPRFMILQPTTPLHKAHRSIRDTDRSLIHHDHTVIANLKLTWSACLQSTPSRSNARHMP